MLMLLIKHDYARGQVIEAVIVASAITHCPVRSFVRSIDRSISRRLLQDFYFRQRRCAGNLACGDDDDGGGMSCRWSCCCFCVV